ncbi:MAG: transglutaminase domain-containing protein [Pirellulales bacterium]
MKLVLLVAVLLCGVAEAAETNSSPAIEKALAAAGKNGSELRRALVEVPAGERPGMEFLVANMPERDLKSLSADFLLENVHLAYVAWQEAPWHDEVSEQLFLNSILPYANVTEARDNWRSDFRQRFLPLVKEAKSPGEAAAILNNKIFEILDVHYNTKCRAPDQGPFESDKTGMATCTGLSILLIDACRSVGVPARFVGIPMWLDGSGNHSWVEVWDKGDWHFTGAAEPNGMVLDKGWFTDRAALAQRDKRRHAIYAVSFERTPLAFPFYWDRDAVYVRAVNVTDRYTASKQELAKGTARAMFRVLEKAGGYRRTCKLVVKDAAGTVAFEGKTNDERFDMNDHTTAVLKLGHKYRVEIEVPSGVRETTIDFTRPDELFTFDLAALTATVAPAKGAAAPVEALRKYLATAPDKRPPLAEQPFARVDLSREESLEARKLLWDDHAAQLRVERAEEMKERRLTAGEFEVPFAYKTFGDKPAGGHSLFISLHGGGEAPKEVNDRQWENQKTLYEPSEGIYVAPRAPTDKWNMWHQEHIDGLFRRLIEDLVVFEDVDPNRVYLMGYSAGGDGVYQLAPRMADSWAAAAMMAGHPNDASPLGLRNIGFAIYVGGKDDAFQRNAVAGEWKAKLDDLQAADPDGYRHLVEIPADKGHWMDRLDAAAVPWMSEFVRNPAPKRIVWKQDDVLRPNFYWLAIPEDQMQAGSEMTSTCNGQTIELEAEGVNKLTLRLDDRLVDLDQQVRVTSRGKTLFEGKLPRRIGTMAALLAERGDPEMMFCAEVDLELPENGAPTHGASSAAK